MGEFFLTPEKDKKYTAWVEYGHRIFNFPLPAASDEGIIMSVGFSGSKDSAQVRVKYSPSHGRPPTLSYRKRLWKIKVYLLS